MNIPALASDWPFASGSWSDIMDVSGSNLNSEKGQPFVSHSPPEGRPERTPEEAPGETPGETLERAHQILIVEDSRADLYLIREAIAAAGVHATLHVVHDGQEAIQFVDNADIGSVPHPDLVLLDLNIPKKDGVEVLRHLRQSPGSKKSLVLVVTSSDSSRDRAAVDALGTNGYFRKPSVYADFLKLGVVVKGLLEIPNADPGTEPLD
jgi:CheY-like chemotaxis protein